MINILLQVLADLLELKCAVVVIFLVSFLFFSYVKLVQLDNRLFEFFVLADVVEGIVDLVLEVLNLVRLLLEDLAEVTVLSDQATHAHTQIFYDQAQVVEDAAEVKLLLLHFVCLFFEILDDLERLG